jgi:tRNA (cmo5U34)-methyltransferase
VSTRDNTTAHAADDYDEQVARTIPHYGLIHAEVLDLVCAVRPRPAVWLDTGCGTGALVEQALPLFPGTRFVVADPSEAMLARARQRLGTRDRVTFLRRCRSQEIDRAALPQPDVVTAILAHHYSDVAGRRDAVRRCLDLLPAGGLFVTVENVAPCTEEGLRIGRERWRRSQESQGRPASVVAAHLARYGSEFFPIPLEAHLELLRGLGFRVVEPFWLSVMQAGFYAMR